MSNNNNDNNAPSLKDMYHYIVERARQHQHLPIKERFRYAIQTKVFKDVEYLFRCRAKAMLVVPLTVFAFATFMQIFFSELKPETNQKISVVLIVYVIIALIVSWKLSTRHALKRLKGTSKS